MHEAGVKLLQANKLRHSAETAAAARGLFEQCAVAFADAYGESNEKTKYTRQEAKLLGEPSAFEVDGKSGNYCAAKRAHTLLAAHRISERRAANGALGLACVLCTAPEACGAGSRNRAPLLPTAAGARPLPPTCVCTCTLNCLRHSGL